MKIYLKNQPELTKKYFDVAIEMEKNDGSGLRGVDSCHLHVITDILETHLLSGCFADVVLEREDLHLLYTSLRHMN